MGCSLGYRRRHCKAPLAVARSCCIANCMSSLVTPTTQSFLRLSRSGLLG